MPLDPKALSLALAQTPQASPEGLETLHSALCRREAPAFQRAAQASTASGDTLLVACTQEQRLFLELNEQTEGAAGVAERPIRFVNIRETGGWSRDAREAMPKIAALLAAAQAPAAQPVTTVGYRSAGRCLVIGDAAAAAAAAAMLSDKLDATLLVEGGPLPQAHELPVQAGRLTSLRGWLGAFDAEWESGNPIDLDLCTRCNACIDACPESAIDFSYQVQLDACQGHRACVRVCEAPGAIDFTRAPRRDGARFDLVLDLRAQAAFAMHQKPQGYFHVAQDPRALIKAVLELREAVGEFEKPKFFHYQPALCAHSRNEQIGCRACIDVCSAQAIRSDASMKGKAPAKGLRRPATPEAPTSSGGGIVVEPHLCVGCGACSTVCPSGALSFAYPGPADLGLRMRGMLSAYAAAGGRDAALLLHSEGAGARAVAALGRAARTDKAVRGVPARVLPLALWHTASVGIDLWLAALAQGASQVWVLLSDEEAPEYRQALAAQMAVAQAIVSGLGYRGEHFRLIDSAAAGDARTLDTLLAAAPAQTVARAARFAVQADKRPTLEMAIEHLLAQAPQPHDDIALPATGSPFGSLLVDTERCTMCLSCVGACPRAALADNPERPELRFIEANCVQCGLCATTCPEDAITLQPRLWLADAGKARKAPRVIHRMEPYCCVRCAKPFGTLRAVEHMIGKLASHAAFQGKAAERLKMCSDCRVIDMHRNPDEVRITDIPR
ncbi:MAG: 4Fe-4S binding protein [Rubrivivax sp.]|nr:4Fe-4S binding protein [Rubrivivax sp.]